MEGGRNELMDIIEDEEYKNLDESEVLQSIQLESKLAVTEGFQNEQSIASFYA